MCVCVCVCVDRVYGFLGFVPASGAGLPDVSIHRAGRSLLFFTDSSLILLSSNVSAWLKIIFSRLPLLRSRDTVCSFTSIFMRTNFSLTLCELGHFWEGRAFFFFLQSWCCVSYKSSQYKSVFAWHRFLQMKKASVLGTVYQNQ